MAVDDIYLARYVTLYQPTGKSPVVAFNMVHYRVSVETGVGATPVQVANALDANAGPGYKGILADNMTYLGVLTAKIFPLPLMASASSILQRGVGVRPPGEVLPTQVCGILTKRTALIGRRNRGRLYVPFPLEDDSDSDGTPTPPHLTRMNNLALAIFTTAIAGVLPNTTTLVPTIFHGPVGLPPRFIDITSVIARDYWGIQRKRNNAFHADVQPLFT